MVRKEVRKMDEKDYEEIRKIYECLQAIQYFKNIQEKGGFAEKIYNLYQKQYGVNVVKELLKMELWLDLNPKRRKKDYYRFIYNWLNSNVKRIQWKQLNEEIQQREKERRKYHDGTDYKITKNIE
jgi:hypothetical protein